MAEVKKLPEKRVFFVTSAAPEQLREMRPNWVTDRHLQKIKLGEAFWRCACGYTGVNYVPRKATIGGVKGQRAHWQSEKVDGHQPECAFRLVAAFRPARAKRNPESSITPRQKLQHDAPLILMINALPRGQSYNFKRLQVNGIPQKGLPYNTALARFRNNYISESAPTFAALIKNLPRALKNAGDLNNTYLSSGGAVRPVKRAFINPDQAIPEVFLHELLDAQQALARTPAEPARNKASRRAIEQETLFPRLVNITPSREQMNQLQASEPAGQLSPTSGPALRGHGVTVSRPMARGEKHVINFKHDVIFADPEQRQLAADALRKGEDVWVLAYPRVQFDSRQGAYESGKGTTEDFEYQMVVPRAGLHVGPLPGPVLAGLKAPFVDMLSDPSSARAAKKIADLAVA